MYILYTVGMCILAMHGVHLFHADHVINVSEAKRHDVYEYCTELFVAMDE
jgi:hypothetical protein